VSEQYNSAGKNQSYGSYKSIYMLQIYTYGFQPYDFNVLQSAVSLLEENNILLFGQKMNKVHAAVTVHQCFKYTIIQGMKSGRNLPVF
jgi:hypothetical protein